MSQPTAPSQRLPFPDLLTESLLRRSSVSERLIRRAAEKQINEKILANIKFTNSINIIKDFRN